MRAANYLAGAALFLVTTDWPLAGDSKGSQIPGGETASVTIPGNLDRDSDVDSASSPDSTSQANADASRPCDPPGCSGSGSPADP